MENANLYLYQMKNPVLILGANYLGRIANEIFKLNGAEVYGFLDDDVKLHRTELDEVSILGSTDDDGFLKLIGKKCEAFVAVDDNRLRKTLTKNLHEARHVQPVNAIHPSAIISTQSAFGHGNLVCAGAILSPASTVGSHCIVHSGVTIGVGVSVGDYVQIGMGTHINSAVTIDEEAFIGSGVTIVSGVRIGKGARVGAGSVVISEIKDGETVFGNPAQALKS
jgi:sugar O-acyltransferase (sialic acid O-acetyltransferase NeuD family)